LVSPHDVPASKLIEKVARYLKDNVDTIAPPQWASIAKTGMHSQRPPQNPDWWYVRCASVFRKIYVQGPVGVERLRAQYGGRKDYGVRPEHAAKAGGSPVRKAIQQLEAAGFVETSGSDGRRVSKEGRKLLEEIAEEVSQVMVNEVPELKKFQRGS